MKVKFGWKHFHAQTPKRIRMFGYAIMAASTFVAATWTFVLQNDPKTAEIFMYVGFAGKFITSLFASDEKNDSDTPAPGSAAGV